MPSELLRLLRPHQWIKNGFVLVAPFFAHAWSDPDVLFRSLLALVAFSLTSSAVYIGNDLHDVERDRAHPTKSRRPIAAGRVSSREATTMAVLLLALGLPIAALAGKFVLVCCVAYVALQVAYTIKLKHVVLLDVFAISSGFMLRILAGSAAAAVAPSNWLLLCGLMATLFLGFAKRRAEMLGSNGNGRKVLESYNPALLDKFLGITGACVIMGYALYTTSAETIEYHGTSYLIATLPFVVYGVFRYLTMLHGNQRAGEDASADILRDRHLQGALVGWLVSTFLILFL